MNSLPLKDYDLNKPSYFRTELILAIIIAAVASLAAFSNLLFTSNDVFPYTADAMGHLTKVKYLADCWKEFKFPLWFPQWYNGSTIMQYYPPLSYLLMAPIQILTNNVTLTYKIFCFLSLFIGGMGVWLFCKKFVGNWCGLFAIVVYCVQPFLTLSLFEGGVMAQAPIFALTPWFLISVMSYTHNPRKLTFFFNSLLTFLLILSHAMHAYMICFCVVFVLFIFFVIRKLTLLKLFFVVFSIGIGALLAAFWWVVGVTGLEIPGVPILLEEAGLLFTATIKWFITKTGTDAGLVFGLSVTIASFIAVIVYIVSGILKANSQKDKYFSLFCIILTLLSIVFSFGQHNPLFKLVPLYKSLVPGRILSLTSASAAIVCAYLLLSMARLACSRNILIKLSSAVLCIAVIFGVLIPINPYSMKFDTMDVSTEYEEIISHKGGAGSPFDRGRYEWVAPVNSAETFFPTQYGFILADGWNIEGTPHNRTVWLHNIALVSNCEEYLLKSMLFWNVRYIHTLKEYERFCEVIENSIYNFKYERQYEDVTSGLLYTSDVPSSYYLIDYRNCRAIGAGAPPIALEFPFMVKDFSNDILDYPLDELKKYKLLYLAEIEINSLEHASQIEDVIEELVQNGTTVIIEPPSGPSLSLFGVETYPITLKGDCQLVKQPDIPFESSVEVINFKEDDITRALNGLDEVYYMLKSNGGRVQNSVIGAKNIDGGKVYYVGMHLSRYLRAGTVYIFGNRPDQQFPYADEVKTLLLDMFSIAKGYNDSFEPGTFPVESSVWDYKGGTFEYDSDKPQEVIVSVSYTPRWKVKIDGVETKVSQRENLILLDLPAGKHKVELVYGTTIYGKIGYAVTAFGILLLLCVVFYDGIIEFIKNIGKKLAEYFEIK